MSVAPPYELPIGSVEQYIPVDYEIPDEEAAQVPEAIRTPLTEAESALVEENFGLVYAVARKLRSDGKWFDMDDAVGYGSEGLCRAAQTFDESRGIPFGNYAVLKIWGRIIDGFREFDKARGDTARSISVMNLTAISLDKTVKDDGTATVQDLIPSRVASSEEAVFERVNAVLENSQLAEAMTLLDEQEYALMAGLARGIKKRDIAAELQVDPSRISQIYNSAIRLLRSRLGVNTEITPLEAVRTYLYKLPDEKVTLDGTVDNALCAYTGIRTRTKLNRTLHSLEDRGMITHESKDSGRKPKPPGSYGTVVRLSRRRDARQVADDLEIIIDDPLLQP